MPSQNASLAISTFLGIAGASVLWAPNEFSAFLNYVQYILIFLVVVPFTVYVLKSKRARWSAFLSLWIITNSLTILTATVFLFGDVPELRKITLRYGNQNQLYWLISNAFIFNIALLREKLLNNWMKPVSLILAIIELILVFGGLTLSAILMLGVGTWLTTAWILHRHHRQHLIVFAILTGIGAILASGIIIQYWDRVYIEASLHVRIPHYLAALESAIAYFPLGAGLESSNTVFKGYPKTYPRSIHNFFLAYFVELGIVGAASFTGLLVIWLRNVLIKSFLNVKQIDPFEFSFIAVFVSYLFVIIFQPVPVHRYWWYIFGVSWAAVFHQTRS